VARQYGDKNRNFNGVKLLAPGYAVSTVGFELEKVKQYIAQIEKLEKDGKF
jgi:putative transposase